jgi:hypothetical protein
MAPIVTSLALPFAEARQLAGWDDDYCHFAEGLTTRETVLPPRLLSVRRAQNIAKYRAALESIPAAARLLR